MVVCFTFPVWWMVVENGGERKGLNGQGEGEV